MRLYTDFYSSDIIVASPLGLRRNAALAASGHAAKRESRKDRSKTDDNEWDLKLGVNDQKKRRVDDSDDGYLSSIEICVIDGGEILSMQNWETLTTVLASLNNMPTHPRETDFSRVREWALDGHMRRFRQSVVLSSYKRAEFLSIMRTFQNHAGRVHIMESPVKRGALEDVPVSMRQSFFRVSGVASPQDSPEKRFVHFKRVTLPAIRALIDAQTMVVVPDYFDFVRVRNLLVKTQADDPDFKFASMCEYSKSSDVTRARARLFNRHVSVAVMTERFHFFWRHWIRGMTTIVWYAPPHNAHFYPEILGMTAEAAERGRHVQSMALYDEFDSFALERIVGFKRAKRMTAKESKSTFVFVS